MADKIENLFSPERLREKWVSKNHVLKQGASEEDSFLLSGYEQLYDSIQEMIQGRFSGDDRRLLGDLADQLKEMLDLRFSKTGGKISGEKEVVALNLEIDQALAQIEDLIEAFGLQGKGL